MKQQQPPGHRQRAVLRLLREAGPWWPGCGWSWITWNQTTEVLETLVNRGLVTKDGNTYTIVED